MSPLHVGKRGLYRNKDATTYAVAAIYKSPKDLRRASFARVDQSLAAIRYLFPFSQ